jgi:hypothetical protein
MGVVVCLWPTAFGLERIKCGFDTWSALRLRQRSRMLCVVLG